GGTRCDTRRPAYSAPRDQLSLRTHCWPLDRSASRASVGISHPPPGKAARTAYPHDAITSIERSVSQRACSANSEYTRTMHEPTNRRSVQLDPDRLRLERQRQALTQQELAHRAGVTRLAISELERGLVQPRLPTLRKLADALGIKPVT